MHGRRSFPPITTVTVSIVLYESAADIGDCLRALLHQTRPADEVVIVDNSSTDGGLEQALAILPGARAIRNDRNVGFAAGQNRAMAAARADVHVALNPDCQLGPSFLERACATLDADPDVGSVSGRLLRFRTEPATGLQPIKEMAEDVLDSTGMVAYRNRRVLDRGSEEPARSRYLDDEYVFGASGAAAVYRGTMLDDVAVAGEVFDEDFFVYREDVDLAWRAQLRGWRCRYVPAALARHRRRVAPGRRRALPAPINRHSIANRWRMIARNETGTGWRRDWWSIAARDLVTIGYCLAMERESLSAIGEVLGSRHRLRAWRREIMARRVAEERFVADWFGRRSAEPVTSDIL